MLARRVKPPYHRETMERYKPTQESATVAYPADVRLAIAKLAMKPIQPDGDWRDEALCSVVDPELFDEVHNRKDEAKEYCAACTVKEQCLEYALRTNQDTLIWGGLTADERRALRRQANRIR